MNYDVFISYNSTDKQIADAVCHHLEERRLRCFIAPRDIVPPDWASSITDAIEHAQAFVIVVSEHSLASNEVAKEIALATRVSNFIFPFRIDQAELDGRTNYHLAPFHWIDAVTPPIEKRLKELADRVETALRTEQDNVDLPGGEGGRNRRRQRLLGQSVSPRAEFVGRERELEELSALYENGATAVFLCGMGGIGKSEIAKAFAKRHREQYTTVIFAAYETNLCDLIADDAAIPVENLNQAAASGGKGETVEAYYARKMETLRSIVDKHTLLIIDNFDTEGDEHLEEVLALPCHILLTSRTNFSAYGYETLTIGTMDREEDMLALFSKLDRAYPEGDEREAVREIIRLLDGHTYAVSLTAAQMKAGHIKPTKMLEQLRREGLRIQTRSTFARSAGEKRGTAYDYIKAMFDFTKLDERSCQVIRYLACMPKGGVETDVFLEFTGIEDFTEISRLIDLNWVQMDDENDRLGLHMLVRELAWEALRPSQESCEPLLNGIYEGTKNAWNAPIGSNRRIESMVYAVMESFPDVHAAYLDHFEAMATFAWIMGNFTLSEKCELTLFQLCEDTWGAVSEEAGNQALRVAAVYHNQGDYARARPWYQKGWDILRQACGESISTYAAASKVARSNAQLGDIASAKEIYTQKLSYLEGYEVEPVPEKERKYQISLAFTRLELGHVCAIEGDFDRALPLCQLAYDYLKTDQVEPSLVIYALTDLMRVLYGMGRYEEALQCCEQADEATAYYRGRDCIDALFLQEMKGDILVRQGRFEHAAEEYSAALGKRDHLYPCDTEALARLEEKHRRSLLHDGEEIQIQEYWT